MNADTIELPFALDYIADCFAWCVVQVTLFASVALLIYAFLRRQGASRNVLLLTGSLATVGLLTLMFVSPWPRWEILGSSPSVADLSSGPIAVLDLPLPDQTKAPRDTSEASGDERGPQQLATPRPSPRRTASQLENPPQPPTAPQPAAAATRHWWRFAIGAAWLVAAVGIARFLVGLAYLHRCRHQIISIDDDQLQDEFHSLTCKLHVIPAVSLVEAPSLGVPATIGWRRPLVLLPSTWRDWTADERRAVLAHELSHVAQRHFPLWLVGQLAVAAHFYHPLVHWLARRLRLEQELAADQMAVRAFGSPCAYAEILAGLALGPERRAAAHASLGLLMSRPLLMRRIAMLRQRTSVGRPSRFTAPAGLVLLLFAACVAFGLRATSPVVANEPASIEAPAASTDQPASNAADTCEVTALFKVPCNQPSVLSTTNQSVSDKGWEVFCKTQVTYFHSYYVLQVALNVPGVRDLPLVKAQTDPLQWLNQNLDVGFSGNSEIMYVKMRGKPADAEQLRTIVDAVCNAYLNEVVHMERQQRLLVKDALQRSIKKLYDEIHHKLDTQNQLAEELGIADRDGTSRVMQDIDIKRLDRIETELLRLENEQLAANIYSDQQKGKLSPQELARLPFYEQRIAELRKRQTKLEKRIAARNRSSVELEVGAEELKQLQEIAREMSFKLETYEIEEVAPERIQLIQKAM